MYAQSYIKLKMNTSMRISWARMVQSQSHPSTKSKTLMLIANLTMIRHNPQPFIQTIPLDFYNKIKYK